MTQSFAYRAYRPDGRVASGVLAAGDAHDAFLKLERQGLVPFETRPAKAGGGGGAGQGRRMRAAELALVIRAIATLLEAGIPIDAALRLSAEQLGTARRKAVVARLHEDMVAGKSLAEAMAAQPTAFASTHVAVVRAGEATGSLTHVLADLGLGLEREAELAGRLRSAFVYPGILLVVALMAMTLVFAVMVPAIAPLFDGQSRPLPFVLWAAEAVGRGVMAGWPYLLAAGAAAGLLLRQALRNGPLRRRLGARLAALPGIAPLVRNAAAARFARTLAILLRGGAALPHAVAVAAETVGEGAGREALLAAVDSLRRGIRLTPALAGFAALSNTSRGLIRIGEESNRLPEMLTRVAETHEAELKTRVEWLMTLLTPLLTVLIGAAVGGIILSVMNAILSANDLAL